MEENKNNPDNRTRSESKRLRKNPPGRNAVEEGRGKKEEKGKTGNAGRKRKGREGKGSTFGLAQKPHNLGFCPPLDPACSSRNSLQRLQRVLPVRLCVFSLRCRFLADFLDLLFLSLGPVRISTPRPWLRRVENNYSKASRSHASMVCILRVLPEEGR